MTHCLIGISHAVLDDFGVSTAYLWIIKRNVSGFIDTYNHLDRLKSI